MGVGVLQGWRSLGRSGVVTDDSNHVRIKARARSQNKDLRKGSLPDSKKTAPCITACEEVKGPKKKSTITFFAKGKRPVLRLLGRKSGGLGRKNTGYLANYSVQGYEFLKS